MSPGGVAVHAPVKGDVGERVVIYFDQLGRVEGKIVRHIESGFALALNVPMLKREKLADQLTWLANRQSLGMPEDRRHERVVPHNPRSTLILSDGREYMAKIIDVRRSPQHRRQSSRRNTGHARSNPCRGRAQLH
jgi:hypothetical protein